jgi:hypothetical protein
MFKIIIIYALGIVVWIFDVVIPFGKKILLHIQNHVNNNIDLDLIYCGKQLLIAIGYTILLYVCIFFIIILMMSKKTTIKFK